MIDKKEKYQYPTIEIILLDDADFIIATSGDIYGPGYPDQPLAAINPDEQFRF